MHRVQADFNTMNAYVGQNDHRTGERRRVWLTPQSCFRIGLRVILFQDEDDFEVEGVIERDTEQDSSGYKDWYAVIDWSTRRDLYKEQA